MSDKIKEPDLKPGRDSQTLDSCILRCAGAEPEALSLLYDAAAPAVFAFALSMLKNRQDAEDVLQDCFINIYTASPSYRSCGRPMAWIMTIARNLCLSRIRERCRQTEVQEEDWESLLYSRPGLSPEDRLTLRFCLQELGESERQILVLHAVSGFKHREIASFLDMPLATVLSKYSRASKKLRSILEREITP